MPEFGRSSSPKNQIAQTSANMDTFEAIRQRRSVKQYDPAYVMPPEHERQLLDAALLSPTSFNIQHWRFVIAKDPTVKKRLRAAAFNQAQVEEAQLTIVLCADLHAWDREPERYYRDAPEKTRNYLVPMLQNLYRDNHQLMRDEAMRSVGIAAQTLMLAAKALGYDSGALVGFDPAKVNPNGGAVALGHALAATGTILTVKCLHELQRTQKRYGLVTMCIGGGQGISAIFERI